MALLQVIVLATTTGTLGAEPVELKPQFEADSPDDLQTKIEAWLETTSYKQVEGSEIRVFEIDVETGKPKAEPVPTDSPAQPEQNDEPEAPAASPTDGSQASDS